MNTHMYLNAYLIIIIVALVTLAVSLFLTLAVSLFLKKKTIKQKTEKSFEDEVRELGEQTKEDYMAVIKPNCLGSLDSLVLLSFSEEKVTVDIIKLASLKGWRPLEGDEVKMFADLSVSACEKGLYVNLLNFGSECFGELIGDGPIPTMKVFDINRVWNAGTFFTFVVRGTQTVKVHAPDFRRH